MKVFLSWSGHASHELACALRDWLPLVLPFTVPWVSSEDIDKGARWSTEISTELSDSNFGIICIVPGNVGEPWLNFEAGAISKSLEEGRVAPFLVGVKRNEIVGPLSQFQLTIFEKVDVCKLIKSMNNASENPSPAERLSKCFGMCWHILEESIGSIELEKNTRNDGPPDRRQEEQKIGEENKKVDHIRHMILAKMYSGNWTTYEEVEEFIGENLESVERELFTTNLRATCIEEGSDPLVLSDNGKRRLKGYNTQYGHLR